MSPLLKLYGKPFTPSLTVVFPVQDIEEIHTAKFFAILADEVTDCANLEQVSILIRFVDSEKCIKEEFLGFITVECITGQALATALLSWLKEHNRYFIL